MIKKILLIFAAMIFIVSCSKQQFPQEKYEAAYEQLIAEDYFQAKESYKKLIKSAGSFPELWYDYGTVLMMTGDYSEAIKSFNKTIKLYENAVLYDDKDGLKCDAMTSIGETYLLQADLKNARNQFEKCLEEKKDRDMIIAIAATYIRLGFVDEAESFFADLGIDIWML